MQDGRHARGRTPPLEFDDVITVDLPDDGYVDRAFLRDVFREPHAYLPTRRRRAMRDLEDLPREVESVFAHRAKLTGLLTAITALVGAVVAAAVLSERPTTRSDAAERPQRSVTDIDALGAFTIAEADRLAGAARLPGTTSHTPSRTRTTSHRDQPAPPKPSEPTSTSPAESTAAHDAQSGDAAGGSGPDGAGDAARSHAPGGSTAAGQGAAGMTSVPGDGLGSRSARGDGPGARTSSGHPVDKLATARTFYRLVERSPRQASNLLSPDVFGKSFGELRVSWRSVHDVRVLDLDEQPDGSVLAVLTMRDPDGTPIRSTQLLEFSSTGLISHVQLLSAQHS